MRRRLLFYRILAVVSVFLPLGADSQIITTVAGGGWIFSNPSGRASDAPLSVVSAVAVDAAGNVYAADAGSHIVVKITPGRSLTVVAGNGIKGFSGDNGPAISASLNQPLGVAVDPSGNVYIADTLNQRIRKVTPAGIITTMAGSGRSGFSGDGGPASGSQLASPRAVAADASGNLYIADTSNNVIRKVDASGNISTVAGRGVSGFSGDGGAATAAMLSLPTGVAVDSAGTLYIADAENHRVRRVAGGIITTVAGNGACCSSGADGPALNTGLGGIAGLTVDASGAVYTAERRGQKVRKISGGTISTVAGTGTAGFSGDGGQALVGTLREPAGVAVDSAGNLYVADSLNYRVRRVVSSGTITTLAGSGQGKFAGDGARAAGAALNLPLGIAMDEAGNLYVADSSNHRVRKVTPAGVISTVAGNGSYGYGTDGVLATSTSLASPSDVAVDAAGNLYIADTDNLRVRKVSLDGMITTVAGSGGCCSAGDNVPATSAELFNPRGVVLDATGNLYISEDSRVRKVAGGIITTYAGGGSTYPGDSGSAVNAQLRGPWGLSIDRLGNLYIAEQGGHAVRKVTPAGVISTVAGTPSACCFAGDGGPATSARLYGPTKAVLDATGNMYIADGGNNRIRKVTAAGIISTFAGADQTGFSGDGAPVATALLNVPVSVAVDAAGNLLFSDSLNDRVRKILAAAATVTAVPAAVSLTAVAGSGPGAAQEVRLDSNVPGLFWEATVLTSSGGSWLTVTPLDGQMPAALQLSADASTLAAGSYQGRVEFTAPASPSVRVTVTVTLTVTAAQPANLSVQPSSLSFQATAGGVAPAQFLRIENSGGGVLSWTAQAATVTGNWLSVSATSGTTPSAVRVSVNPSGLAAGSYAGSITVRTSSGGAVVTPVSLLVSEPAGVLLLSQSAMQFRAVEGGGADPEQSFTVLNIGSASIDWSAQATAGWVRISTTSGRSDSGATRFPEIGVSVDPGALSAGFYVALIRVTAAAANNSPQVIRVEMRVLPRGSVLGPVLRPTGLVFVASAGGGVTSSQEVTLSSSDAAPLSFLSQPIGGNFVRRAPDAGVALRDSPGRIVVQTDPTGLSAGVYRAGLTVFTPVDGEQYAVNLLLLLLPSGATPASVRQAEGCSPSSLLLQFVSLFSNFTSAVGYPSPILINARDNCGNPAVSGTMLASFSNGDAPVALNDLKNGQYSASWRPSHLGDQVTVRVRGLWQGLEAQVTAVAKIAPGLNPPGQGPLLSQGGVALGAGFEAGSVAAPGSIISLFGQNLAPQAAVAGTLPLPRTLSGARVLIGGLEAPLFYAGPGQVNVQVPVELSSERQLQIQVETGGIPSAPEPLLTAAGRPGIFTVGGSSQGAILIANTDRLVTPGSPASAGMFLSVYCTGLGATNPTVPSGQAAPSADVPVVRTPVTATVGGQAATVTFAGLAPGFVGVYQVNLQIPAGVAAGDAVPVVLTQGNWRSNSATIAVR